MKNRYLSVLLFVCLLAGLTPASALAAEDTPHTHPVCGAACTHTGGDAHGTVTWTELNQDSFNGGENSGVTVPAIGSGYYLNAGSYYLTEDITVDDEIRIERGTVNLCLNNHRFTSAITGNKTSVFVKSGGALNICDCGSGGLISSGADYLMEADSGVFGSATVSLYGGTLDAGGEIGARARSGSSLTLDGATLKAATGCALDAQPGSTVAVKGGSIESGGQNCVIIHTTDFTMTDGTVSHTGSEAALFFSLNSGGAVSGGAVSSRDGFGIYLADSPVALSGSPVITGGKADIAVSYQSSVTVGENLTGSYTVYRVNWNVPGKRITEANPFAFTTSAGIDHSGHFTAAAGMTGIAVRNGGEGNDQQVQLYRPHDYRDAWVDTDPDRHWKECRYSDCDDEEGRRTEVADHTKCWKNTETRHWQECSVCGWTGGETAPHTEDGGTLTKPATGAEKGIMTYKCSTCDRVLRTEDIPALGMSISGTVTDGGDNAVSGATVRLMQGRTQIGADVTANDRGNYSFTSVAPGLYNVVAEKDGITKTILVELTDADATDENIKMPDGKKNTAAELLAR